MTTQVRLFNAPPEYAKDHICSLCHDTLRDISERTEQATRNLLSHNEQHFLCAPCVAQFQGSDFQCPQCDVICALSQEIIRQLPTPNINTTASTSTQEDRELLHGLWLLGFLPGKKLKEVDRSKCSIEEKHPLLKTDLGAILRTCVSQIASGDFEFAEKKIDHLFKTQSVEIEKLLKQYPDTDPFNGHLSILLNTAAAHDLVDIFTVIWSNPTLTVEERGWSIFRAAENGSALIIKKYWDHSDISAERRFKALQAAANRGHGRIVAQYWNHPDISPADRNLIFMRAAGRSSFCSRLYNTDIHIDIIEQCWDHPDITDETKARVLSLSAESRSKRTVLDTLWQHSDIPSDARGCVLKVLANHRDWKQFRNYWNHLSITAQMKGEALIAAAQAGEFMIIERYFHDSAIDEEMIQKILVAAASGYNKDLACLLVKWMMKSESFPLDTKKEALKAAESQKNTILADFMRDNIKINLATPDSDISSDEADFGLFP